MEYKIPGIIIHLTTFFLVIKEYALKKAPIEIMSSLNNFFYKVTKFYAKN